MLPPSRKTRPPLLIAVVLMVVSGCGPEGESNGGAESSADSTSVSPQPANASNEPPAGVLRAYVWECDGGLRLRAKNLLREGAITLELHEGPRKLPRVASASGAKYADETIAFWSKGSEATFERRGLPPVTCREARALSVLADARERGVLYRGQGNEPGWTVEIGPGRQLSFVTAYGEERHDYEIFTTSSAEDGGVSYGAGTGADRLEVHIAQEPCADDMSGAAFDYRMRVEYGGSPLRGCAAKP